MTRIDASAKPPDLSMLEDTSEASQSDSDPTQKQMKAVSALLRERFGLGR